MAKVKTVWGVDIGKCALKAIKLSNAGGGMRVEAFEIIEYPKVLSEPDADSNLLIRNALEQFLARNTLTDSTVCVAVPGQSSFTRFVKLPPVEPKKIPDIVRFEAEQQIPFPINDVIWRWQTFHDPDSPDVEVGIFAMKCADISDMLAHFSGLAIDVDLMQMAPLALYNFLIYDHQAADGGATLLADVGADKVDLVIADGAKIWTRTIQIGGNSFTDALVRAFKLSFPKAERLKRTAASSKYARQIFQAMRPVFADLVQEIQRSIGYYASLHREARFKRMIGLGNGFRLPGLQKFLEQNLSMPVVRVDNFNRLQPSREVNAPVLAENSLSFAVAYGLAVQGLGEAKVSTNLLPGEIARARLWTRKRPWFAAAAVLVLTALTMPLLRANLDKSALKQSSALNRAQGIARDLNRMVGDYNTWANQGNKETEQIEELRKLYAHRDYWPSLQNLIFEGIQLQARDQKLLTKYADAGTRDEKKAVLAEIQQIKREERQMIFIESMVAIYTPDLSETKATRDRAPGVTSGTERKSEAKQRGFDITITGRTPLGQAAADGFLRRVFRKCEGLADKYPMLSLKVDLENMTYLTSSGRGSGRGRFSREMGMGMDFTMEARGGMGMGSEMETPEGRQRPTRAEIEDPMFPDDPSEDIAKDTRFTVHLAVSVEELPAEQGFAGT